MLLTVLLLASSLLASVNLGFAVWCLQRWKVSHHCRHECLNGWKDAAAARDRYRDALSEMSDELSHYPEGDVIFGHLKRILRRALSPDA
jgi:hypothetical protein